MNEDTLQRVKFLTAKGLPGPAGEQLGLLLKNFYRYQQASMKITGLNNKKVRGTQSEQRFQLELLLKEQYLGKETVESLFGQKHHLLNYLFSRRNVNENTDLSSRQKKQRLAELEMQFQQKRPHYQPRPNKDT
jgi:lipase chaperone LimK